MSVFGVEHTQIVNQALDVIGSPDILGDLEDGSATSRIALRNYAPTIEEMLRAAHWNFARRQAVLTLLQDATGNTPNVGTGTSGMGLWIYSYAWPVDCLKARYVPFTGNINPPTPPGNISVSTTPQTTLPSPWPVARTVPAPFQISQDLVPTVVGAITDWSQYPDLSGTQGQALNQQTVILTNQQNATLVYTALIQQPQLWDPLFRQAVVQAMGAKLALPVWARKDMKFGLAMRGQCIAAAKSALDQARVADGNEGPSNVNHDAQWIRGRLSGGTGWYGAGAGWGAYAGPGYLWGGWEASPFPDGSCY